MKKNAFLLSFILFLTLLGGCTPVEPAPYQADTVRTQTAGAIHTQVAGTMFAAAALLPSTASTATQTTTVTMQPPTETAQPSPTETSARAAIPTAVAVPTMVDVPLLEGYKSYGSRVLAQPAAVVRGGITMAVEQAAVYSDRVELVYTVREIPHELLFDPFRDDPSLTCGGPDSYPNLLLPDGAVIYPESYLLDGKARGMNEPFASMYSIHLYRATIPADVQELTLYLRCLGLLHLDRDPQHWYVPFSIVPAADW